MSGFYGIYSCCRDSAWQCQLDFRVTKLPVKVLSIARYAGIRVIRDSDIHLLRAGELGVSIYDAGQWSIIYNDCHTAEESRMTVAHELGHIFLGHEYRYRERQFYCCDSGRKLPCEWEADMFAIRLLAPAFVLHELRILDADGIASLCGIPRSYAKIRSQRMDILEERGRYYTNQREKMLLERFLPWLSEMKLKSF